ncbi:MAG TPA: Flp family type IVb pilin [Sphingomonas sp.]|uniref:Flp family type IVb pilin n=1 Tax=Sphingomonas sp. TaxID=28214 RepID=UPI002C6ADC7A|nr:Flp family type IVb pilin [Sphingomonas sp.]HMI20794.1 Flp family type IVb pilin [Sphingomonas sp.]
MNSRLIKLVRNKRGATAIEYGLIVALIVIVVVVGISALGGSTGGIWGNMTTKASTAMSVS